MSQTNNQSQTVREKRTLGIICAIAVIAVLVGTLWPFDPFPTNRVHWRPEVSGIEFDGAGLVISKAPLRAAETGGTQSCSLELLLRPAAVDSAYTILSFYAPNNRERFLVKQWTDGLLVLRESIDSRSHVKRTKFDVDHAFQPGKLLLLTIVSRPLGTVVYGDGRQLQAFPKFRISQSDLSGQIVMGTSPVDYQPWVGEVRGLAIYSRALMPAEVAKSYQNWADGPRVDLSDLDGVIALYSFNERTGREIHNAVVSAPDLEIPRSFAIPHKTLLASPIQEFEASWRYVKDLLLNVAGFIPLGFIACGYLASTRSRVKAIVCTILASGMLSFAIEVMQAYIPRRVSGTTDIVTNTLGAAIGAVLARPRAVRRFLHLGHNPPN